jgi:hypothetical protein
MVYSIVFLAVISLVGWLLYLVFKKKGVEKKVVIDDEKLFKKLKRKEMKQNDRSKNKTKDFFSRNE